MQVPELEDFPILSPFWDDDPAVREEEAAALVRSLFSGLPDKELRMAIFVANSDESGGGKFFHHAGLIAPERDWDTVFVPAWQRFVLDREPRIPYLHMTKIRSRAWRAKYGLSDEEGELRVNAAVNIITGTRSIFQICSSINTDYIAELGPLYFRRNSKSKKSILKEDHLCCLAYIFDVVSTVHRLFPAVHRVDFVIENKTGIFAEIERLYREYVRAVPDLAPNLNGLFGEVMPGGKDRIPLQAADVLCWYTQRAKLGTLEGLDIGRYAALAERPGQWKDWDKTDLIDLAVSMRGESMEGS